MNKKIYVLLLLLFTAMAFAQTEENLEVDEKGWTVWANLGGQITSDPAACTGGNFTVVFARGTDNQIWFRKRFLPTGVWAAWKKVPNIPGVNVSGSPAVICYDGGYYVSAFLNVVGSNNRVWTNSVVSSETSDGFGTWYSPTAFNAALFSGPALAGWGINRQHSFVRGGDNRIYYNTRTNGQTSPYQVLVSEFSYNDPAAVMPSTDRVDFFYRDQFGKLWQRFMVGALWYPRQEIPGVTYSSPDVVSRDIYSLDLFAKGAGNTLIHKRSINGVWGSWINLGGNVSSGPGATTYASNARMMVFVRWIDGTLRYRAWAP